MIPPLMKSILLLSTLSTTAFSAPSSNVQKSLGRAINSNSKNVPRRGNNNRNLRQQQQETYREFEEWRDLYLANNCQKAKRDEKVCDRIESVFRGRFNPFRHWGNYGRPLQ